jgi:hypothetical protein
VRRYASLLRAAASVRTRTCSNLVTLSLPLEDPSSTLWFSLMSYKYPDYPEYPGARSLKYPLSTPVECLVSTGSIA